MRDFGAERTPEFGEIYIVRLFDVQIPQLMQMIVMSRLFMANIFSTPAHSVRECALIQMLEILVYSYMTFSCDFLSLIKYHESLLELKHHNSGVLCDQKGKCVLIT